MRQTIFILFMIFSFIHSSAQNLMDEEWYLFSAQKTFPKDSSYVNDSILIIVQTEEIDTSEYGDHGFIELKGTFINHTDSIFPIINQDGELIFVQEYLDSKGNWIVIENWIWSDCGNSFFFPYHLKEKPKYRTKLIQPPCQVLVHLTNASEMECAR